MEQRDLKYKNIKKAVVNYPKQEVKDLNYQANFIKNKRADPKLYLACYELIFLTFRLPFDEAQIEIPDDDKVEDEDQPQGFINNNPR